MPAAESAAFISYSRDDSEFALRLAEDLKAAGAFVWLDQLDIKPGRPWDSTIEEALMDAPRVVLILSPSSSRSNNVRNELSFALDEKKIIIPVLYLDCAVPLQVRRIQHVDFRSNYDRGLRMLLTQLEVHPSHGAIPTTAQTPDEKESATAQQSEENNRLQTQREEAARWAQQLRSAREQEAAERLALEEEMASIQEEAVRRSQALELARQKLLADRQAQEEELARIKQECERLEQEDTARRVTIAKERAAQERLRLEAEQKKAEVEIRTAEQQKIEQEQQQAEEEKQRKEAEEKAMRDALWDRLWNAKGR